MEEQEILNGKETDICGQDSKGQGCWYGTLSGLQRDPRADESAIHRDD
jgi:hypothetical protein